MKNYKFSLEDIKKLEKNIIILVDTREKKNDHILQYFDKYGIGYKKEKLNYGDYTFYIPKNPDLNVNNDMYFHDVIVIERKATLEELSNNLSNKREQFEKELLRATAKGCKMWLSVENVNGLNAILEHSYKTEFKPLCYIASIKTFENRYNLHVNFIDKKFMGYNILSTFKYFLRENLI